MKLPVFGSIDRVNQYNPKPVPGHSLRSLALRGRFRLCGAACLGLALLAGPAAAAVDPARLALVDALVEQGFLRAAGRGRALHYLPTRALRKSDP